MYMMTLKFLKKLIEKKNYEKLQNFERTPHHQSTAYYYFPPIRSVGVVRMTMGYYFCAESR